MSVRDVIIAINQMEADGVIDRYAIGGAVGATFYLEPMATVDIDVFVAFRSEAGRLLADPTPIFDYLRERGWLMQGEYVVIAEWPVQFLPPTGPLVEEAMAEALAADVEGAPARVFSAEHLAAIALQTGRAKDKTRVAQFIEEGRLDTRRFQDILERHDLLEAWARFERQFLTDAP
jgi:hypothetical protein